MTWSNLTFGPKARTTQLRVASRRSCSASVSRPPTSENTARRSAAACAVVAAPRLIKRCALDLFIVSVQAVFIVSDTGCATVATVVKPTGPGMSGGIGGCGGASGGAGG
eukprot:3974047-Prymnesium_polylepis.1